MGNRSLDSRTTNNKQQIIKVKLTHDSEITSRLQFPSCRTRYQRIASSLIDQVTHPNVKLALEFIRDFPLEKLDKIGNDSRFQTILKTVKR